MLCTRVTGRTFINTLQDHTFFQIHAGSIKPQQIYEPDTHTVDCYKIHHELMQCLRTLWNFRNGTLVLMLRTV